MAVYVVAYDLNKERAGWTNDRTKLLKYIKDTWNYARLSESSYAIESSSSALTIFNTLRKFIDSNDDIYVIPLKKTWMGFGPKVVIQWLQTKLED